MNKKILFAVVSGLTVYLFLGLHIYSQNHYWSQQYGPRSSMLGGTVVGGVRDNSALYYNPGAFGFVESENLSISANVYGFESVDLQNAAGKSLGLQSIRPFTYPQFVSGMIQVKRIPRLKLGYGLLTRYSSSYRMLATTDSYIQIPGMGDDQLDYYRGKMEMELNIQSLWGGIGAAYKFNNVFSIGMTMFVNYLHFDDRINIETSVDSQDSLGIFHAQRINNLHHAIDNFGLNFKLGFALNFSKVKFGMTMTTPSINLFGWGSMNRSEFGSNLTRVLGESSSIYSAYNSIAIQKHQKGLDVTYKQPFSVAAGFEYWFKKTKLSFTGELFFPIANYEVMRGDTTYIQPLQILGDTLPDYMVAENGAAAVFNFGIGLDQYLVEGWDLLLSVRTDFNNSISRDSTQSVKSLNPTFWHYIHFTAGINFHRGSSDFSIGVNYGLGISAQSKQLINFTDPQANATMTGQPNNTMKSYVNSIGLSIGYTYYIKRQEWKRKTKKKIE